jgi:Helix-hairpin-helix motif
MACGTRRSLWGWSLPARRLIAFCVVGCAGWLAWASTRPLAPAVDPTLVVDVNTARPEVLAALPRLGPALSARIVAVRAVRPFRSLDDFDARVPGIGPVAVAALRPFLRFPDAPALIERAAVAP